ncbi:hypothetical protein L6R50_00865 [Myxococcota bacterium]|nr:hypothetical protein [Myxococcota bacterium]
MSPSRGTGSARAGLRGLWLAAAAMAALSQVFIAWEWSLGPLSAPLADWGGVLLVGLFPLCVAAGVAPRRLPPAPAAAAVFLAVVGLAAATAPEPGPSLHEWARKGVFNYLAYGAALAAAVSVLPERGARRGVAAVVLALAAMSVVTSLDRVARFGPGEVRAIGGLVNNHKTLAVALAPQLPLALWAWRGESRGAWRRIAALGALLLPAAVVLSHSKTAMVVLAVAVALDRLRARGARRLVLAAAVALPLVLAAVGIGWLGGERQRDATSARHSLDLRAWELVQTRPLLGHGPGASVRHVAEDWPHLRVNGVEAHGVLQKVAAEAGLAGLLAWGALALALLRHLARGPTAALDAGILLHGTLLLSTEAFTASHWVPLGIALGIASRWGAVAGVDGGDAREDLPAGAAAGLGLGAAVFAGALVWGEIRPGAPPPPAALTAAVADFEQALARGDGRALAAFASGGDLVLGWRGEAVPGPAWAAGRGGSGARAAPGPGGAIGLSPVRCASRWDDGAAVLLCDLVPLLPLDAPARVPPGSGASRGLYVVAREGLGLRVVAAVRDGLP